MGVLAVRMMADYLRARNWTETRATIQFVDLERHPEGQPVPGVLVYRIDQPLVYFNVDYVRDQLMGVLESTEPRPRLVVLELSLSRNLDLAAVYLLRELEEQLRLLGADLRLAEVHGEALERLRAEGVESRFGGVGRRVSVAALVAAGAPSPVQRPERADG